MTYDLQTLLLIEVDTIAGCEVAIFTLKPESKAT